MALFSEKEQQAAKDQAVREILRKIGLSHLTVKVTRRTSTTDSIIIEGGTEDQIKRIEAALGAKVETTIKHGQVDSGLKVTTAAKILTRPNSK